MTEFNFFEPYIQVPKKRGLNQYIIVAVLCILAMVLGVYHIKLISETNNISTEIADIQSFLDDKKTQQKLSELEFKQKKIDNMSIFSVYLSDLTLKRSSEDVIDSDLFQMINDQMPKEVFLMDLSIDSGLVNMRGYADSYEMVAQYIYNLRMTGVFNTLSVPNIQEDENGMQFNLVGVLTKEGYNENK